MAEAIVKIQGLDKRDLIVRGVESWLIEDDILERMEGFWQSLLKGESLDVIDSIWGSGAKLRSVLVRRFKEWQFFGEGEEGLNSGGAGEAFSRLLGSGIMEDMPWVSGAPEDLSVLRTNLTDLPNDENDVVAIEIVDYLRENPTDVRICHFRFNTSLSAIRQRVGDVRKEMKERRKPSQK